MYKMIKINNTTLKVIKDVQTVLSLYKKLTLSKTVILLLNKELAKNKILEPLNITHSTACYIRLGLSDEILKEINNTRIQYIKKYTHITLHKIIILLITHALNSIKTDKDIQELKNGIL